jgi:hypothetical protein
VTDVVALDGLEHPVVVLIGDVPHLARFLAPEDAYRFGIAVRHAGQEESRVAPACACGEMLALDQDGAEATLGEVVKQARARDSAADDQHVGAIGQQPRVAL